MTIKMSSKIKILIGILVVGIILVGGRWIWSSQKQVSIEEFCTANVLEDCYGKKVKVIGTFEALTKGCNAGVIVNREKAETIFLPEFVEKCEMIKQYQGKKIELVGIIEKHSCPPWTQCWGRMVIKHIDSIRILEAQAPTTKGVTIITDKAEYEQGETVEITVRNSLNKSIWYAKEICPPFCCALQKLENGKWLNVSMAINMTLDLPVKPSSLRPNEEVIRNWDMNVMENGSRELAEAGTYRISFTYGFSQNSWEEKTIYSNEFMIK